MTVNRLERKARTDSAATTKTDLVSGESHKSPQAHSQSTLTRRGGGTFFAVVVTEPGLLTLHFPPCTGRTRRRSRTESR